MKLSLKMTDYLFISFYVAIVLIRTFITTPFYGYYLKMHDCMAAIMGILVNINAILVIVSWVLQSKYMLQFPTHYIYFTKLALKENFLGFCNKRLDDVLCLCFNGFWWIRYNTIAFFNFKNGGTHGIWKNIHICWSGFLFCNDNYKLSLSRDLCWDSGHISRNCLLSRSWFASYCSSKKINFFFQKLSFF